MTYHNLFVKYNYHPNLKRLCEFLEDTNWKTLDILDTNINSNELTIIENNIQRVLDNYPIEYILNTAYFFGLKLYINDNCLVPRDETEELVQWILEENNGNLKLLDLCCGTGAIGLALKAKNPKYLVTLSDLSNECVNVAKTNLEHLGLEAKVIQSDLFQNINEDFDIIVSNPPYIALGDNDVAKSVYKYEPHLALYTDDDKGLEFYKKIFDHLSTHNFKFAYFEFGYKQKEDLINLLENYSFIYTFKKDLNGNDRMLKIQKDG